MTTSLHKTSKQRTPFKDLLDFQEWDVIQKAQKNNKTPPTNYLQTPQPTPKTKQIFTFLMNNNKTKTPILLTKTTTTQRKTSPTKFANHPDYEFDTMKKRWVKKSDIRPPELVNRYKVFLMDYLKKNTTMDHKEIEKLVRKHATSTNRLKEILVAKGVMTQRKANIFFSRNNFWHKELCGHMKTICPTKSDLAEIDWCKYHEDAFYYYKDKNTNHISCYSVNDIYSIINMSFTGGDEDAILLQLPRDPYTRKVLTEEFIKKFLKQIQHLKEDLNKKHVPHVVYFLRNYKNFYSDPKIKPFLTKNTLTKKETWQLSNAIEDFLTKTNEIEHGWATGHIRSWFWVDDEKNEPASLYDYIFKK